jgi:hypothetical protein
MSLDSNLLNARIANQSVSFSEELEALLFAMEKNFKPNDRQLTASLKDNPHMVASAILQASDFYIQNPSAVTPWNEPWMQIAQVFYFLPLNFVRCLMVCDEAERLGFFQGLHGSYDFGVGLGASSLALQTVRKNKQNDFVFQCFDSSTVPLQILQQSIKQNSFWQNIEPLRTAQLKSSMDLSQTLIISSYSMTELPELPAWMVDAQALMIIEPSTQTDGRKLMSLRQQLIDQGFYIWAPCTHQQLCPLLNQSKTDWCHDRIHLQLPNWMQTIETLLPMKNRTITWSYLLAKKTPPPAVLGSAIRTVGDQLEQKGKTRQLMCRGPEREYLAWMHRNGQPQEIPRGVLLRSPTESKKVSDDLRITTPLDPMKF